MVCRFENLKGLLEISGKSGIGVGKSQGTSGANPDFPAVPYTPKDFKSDCDIDYNNRGTIQNCRLTGLPDLRLETDYVQEKIAAYLNKLINLGVAGFRVDAVKHMYVQ